MTNILFLPQGTIKYPSTRYRLYQFLPALHQMGINTRVLHYPSSLFGRATFLLRLTLGLLWADAIFVQKRVPTPRIRILITRLKNRMIYDFDDAVYTINPSRRDAIPNFDAVQRRQREDLAAFMGDCVGVIAGNKFLAEFARQHNPRVHIIPTVVDTATVESVARTRSGVVTIGWIGAQNNLYYLGKLDEVFSRLHDKYGDKVRLKVICDAPFKSRSPITVVNTAWDLATEISELAECDVGLMPLVDDEWNRGKCAFKMLFCMQLGIPVVTSPVGVNRDIIVDGQNGLIAGEIDEWEHKLSLLIDDQRLRERLGAAGRCTIERDFSLDRYAVVLARILKVAAHPSSSLSWRSM